MYTKISGLLNYYSVPITITVMEMYGEPISITITRNIKNAYYYYYYFPDYYYYIPITITFIITV